MQGQKGAGNSFADTIDLNQGSVSSTNGPNQHNLRTFGDCHMGESSSSTSPNPQSHGISSSTRVPLNINLNAEHMATGSDNSDAFSYNVENDGASSFKRKALEGDAIDQHDLHSCHNSSSITTSSPPLQTPSFSQPEELSLRIGIGRGVASSDVFNPITVTEIGESSSRNHGVSVSNENDRFNVPPTRNVMRLSDFRPAWSNTGNQPQSIHTNEMSRNLPPFPFHENANSRGGGSLTSAFISAERGDSMERSPFAHGRRTSASHSPSPWATPQQHGSSRNSQRSSQFYPWAPFPSANSTSQFPPLQSDPSSSEETIMPSGTNQGHHHNHHHAPFPRPSMMMEFQGDDISEWHALAADIEGRQRLVSEIRNVLNSMRRGDNLRDEDYMLFDPFINGIAEFHDRHRDMRLDVDNMSYEELLALEERMGDVNTGLSEEAIMRSMKQRKHLCLFDRSSSNLEPCSICREEYVLGDNVGELDCGHDFHTDCVKQWLTQKNLCPICKTTALAT